MSAGRKVPEIRFKGFAGEWVEKTLGEIGSLKNGMNFDKSAMGHGYPFVNLQNVFGKNEISDENLGLAISTENQRKDYSLNEGDVLFIRSSVKPEGVGEAAVVPKTMENTTYSGFIIRFRPNIEMNVNFNRFIYSTSNCRKQILASSTSSANSNINQNSLQRVQFALPCKLEQTDIGNYFQKLDTLINQHQQKHDKLCNIKKTMLEKMFPKLGETIPEIRFKGFSGEWVKKKLGNITEITMGQSPSGENYTENPNDYILVQGNADLKNGFVVPRIWTSEVTKIATKSALIFSVRAPVGEVGKTNYDVVLGRGVAAIYGNEFIYQQLKKLKSDNYWYTVSAGSTFDAISSSELASTFMWVSSESEQEKIGNYFQKLDNLINQHQQQITKLNNIKQACLSKMFV